MRYTRQSLWILVTNQMLWGSKEEGINLVNIYGILTIFQDCAKQFYMDFLIILTEALWILYFCPHYTDKETEAQKIWSLLIVREPGSAVVQTPNLSDFSKDHSYPLYYIA